MITFQAFVLALTTVFLSSVNPNYGAPWSLICNYRIVLLYLNKSIQTGMSTLHIYYTISHQIRFVDGEYLHGRSK